MAARFSTLAEFTSNRKVDWRIETVEQGNGAAIGAVRELWSDYWRSLGLPPDFQGFQTELRNLPGQYAAPSGRLFLVRAEGRSVATGAFRKLSDIACEAKRVYVDPTFRNRGIANSLLQKLIEEAAACGYKTLYADTLPEMSTALELYRKSGFMEVEPYSENPTPGAIFLRLSLQDSKRKFQA